MSNWETERREELSDAANLIDGITVTPWYRQTTRAGSGYVTIGKVTPDTSGFGWVTAWDVIIVLPADIAQAEKWMADRLIPLLENLKEIFSVVSATPSSLSLDTGQVPCVVINGQLAQ